MLGEGGLGALCCDSGSFHKREKLLCKEEKQDYKKRMKQSLKTEQNQPKEDNLVKGKASSSKAFSCLQRDV